MSDNPTRPQPRLPARPSGYRSVEAEPAVAVPKEPAKAADVEQRVAITLNISDGFRFGCGFILAGIAFYFALMIVVAVAVLVAAILGVPVPFLGNGR